MPVGAWAPGQGWHLDSSAVEVARGHAISTQPPRPFKLLGSTVGHGPLNTDTLIEVLDQLGKFYSDQRVVLIWDGLSAHEHPHAGLPRQPARLAHRRAPPRLRPELNPVEYLWANLKDLELANLPTTTLEEVADATTQGIKRVCKRDDLVTGFLAPTGLALDDEPSTQPTNQ